MTTEPLTISSEARLGLLKGSLPTWLIEQRWFGAKTRAIASVEIIDWMPFSTVAALIFVQVLYAEGTPDTYQLPLLLSGEGISDATADEAFRQSLLKLMEDQAEVELPKGATLSGRQTGGIAAIRGVEKLVAKVGSAEQSNTCIVFGDKMILKLFRRLEQGENPDVEIGRFLTEVAHFHHIPRLLGEISLQQQGEEKISIAMLQNLVANEGDGWSWTLDQLAHFDGSAAPPFLEAISLLGRRTAAMHLALATETLDDAFRSEPLTTAELEADVRRIRTQIDHALSALEQAMPHLKAESAAGAAKILSSRSELIAEPDAILREQPSGRIIRIHGDYHLGQVLRTADDFVILDFEGEPAASLPERRKKSCPLKDVAGMLQSFSYAAGTSLQQRPALLGQLQLWQEKVSYSFFNAYCMTMAAQPGLLPQPALMEWLLRSYQLEKASYELLYELNNRPTWVGIPIAGILTLISPVPPASMVTYT